MSRTDTQIRRIREMETAFDECRGFLVNIKNLLEEWKATEPRLRALAAYYEGPLWRRDFADDEKGKFPPDLKRGVLSEDGVYDLLREFDEVSGEWETAFGKGK